MTDETKIQWCDYTFNPWLGCTKVSTECKNCYAESWAKRSGLVQWGDDALRRRTSDANWRKPLKWNRQAERDGVRRRVFCASLADVFEDRSSVRNWRLELFEYIDATPDLDWLLLTKRPENVERFAPNERPRNAWLGTTCGHPDTLHRVAALCMIDLPIPVRFVSVEPLLTSLRLTNLCHGADNDLPILGSQWGPDWIIVGGESGGGARECHVDWVRNIVTDCRATQVPVFVKQLGARPVGRGIEPLTDRKGGDMAEWPEDLQVREFPK